MRSLGLEEEFLLVDAQAGNHAAVGENPVAATSVENVTSTSGWRSGHSTITQRNTLTTGLQREQLEAVSAPFTCLPDLAAALKEGRTEATARLWFLERGLHRLELHRSLPCLTWSERPATVPWKSVLGWHCGNN